MSGATSAPAATSLSIPRVHARALSSADFLAQFVDRNRPIIVEGALDSWQWRRPAEATEATTAGGADQRASDHEGSADADRAWSSRDWTVARLQQVIGPSAVQNVFVASAHHRRRFKYFKSDGNQADAAATVAKEAAAAATAAAPATPPIGSEENKQQQQQQHAESGLGRSTMTFDEFVEKSAEANAATDADAPAYYVSISASQRTLCCTHIWPIAFTDIRSGVSLPHSRSLFRRPQLYGEPMPPALQPMFPAPEIVRSPTRIPRSSFELIGQLTSSLPRLAFFLLVLPQLSALPAPLTSTLLWVSPAPTCSPLHYDLSEGILAQVHGSKRVTLVDPKYYAELYPYPLHHAHDRQSRLDDLHSPSPTEFPRAAPDQVPRWSGIVGEGEFVYIPYGWWHQLESIDTSVSVSQRWNTHAAALQRLATAWHVTARMPVAIREQICRAQMDAVPKVVAMVNRRRWDELP